MAENDDDNDNFAVAILVNVLMKLEQLILEPFKVQIFQTQPKALLQGNNCSIKSNVHPRKGKKNKEKEKENGKS